MQCFQNSCHSIYYRLICWFYSLMWLLWYKTISKQTMCSPKLLCLPPIANTLRDLDMRFTWVLTYTPSHDSILELWRTFPNGERIETDRSFCWSLYRETVSRGNDVVTTLWHSKFWYWRHFVWGNPMYEKGYFNVLVALLVPMLSYFDK